MDKTLASVVVILLITIGAIYKVIEDSKARRHHEAVVEADEERLAAKVAERLAAPRPTIVPAEEVPLGSCKPEDLRLQYPIGGLPERDWLIANYFDQDPAIGKTRDYTGATGPDAVTYDGHSGIDFEVPSYREVDLGVPVIASADGVVEELYDKSNDHNYTCSSDLWNYVKLRHPNGYATIYGHMKKNSIMVKVGQEVATGTPLGVVGSSGCSSYPHVHLETLDCQGQAFDMMAAHEFDSPPQYSRLAPASLMETAIFQPTINSVKSVQEPGPSDISLVSMGHPFSVSMTVSHLKPGDRIRIEFLNPSNEIAPFSYDQTANKYFARSHWWGNFHLDKGGTWTIIFRINDQVQLERSITAVD